MNAQRGIGVVAAATIFTLAGAGPALAVIDPPNKLGCHANAVIKESNGKSITISANDSKIKLPREGSVAFEGGTLLPIAQSHGQLQLHFGYITLKVRSYDSPNIRVRTVVAGVSNLPTALKYAPPGDYVVTGEAVSAAGSCSGHVTIVLSGSPLSNPVGVAALVGTFISLVGVGLAARARLAKGQI